jgi:hypothetical protein
MPLPRQCDDEPKARHWGKKLLAIFPSWGLENRYPFLQGTAPGEFSVGVAEFFYRGEAFLKSTQA